MKQVLVVKHVFLCLIWIQMKFILLIENGGHECLIWVTHKSYGSNPWPWLWYEFFDRALTMSSKNYLVPNENMLSLLWHSTTIIWVSHPKG